MTDGRDPGVGRLGMAAAWISAVCCLPYLVLKVVWTVGLPLGITDRSLLDSNDWVAGNALMALIELSALLLVLALTRPWARRVPTWLLLFPVWVGTGLLFQVVVGAVLAGLFSATSDASGGSTDFGGIQPWVFVTVYSSFAGQGAALAIAFACHVRARWGWLLGERTGEVVSARTARMWSWPERHLTESAEIAAGMAVAVALLCWYWAMGGSFGLSDARPLPTWAMQASGVAAAVTAVVGLLGLAGRWGHHTRFWLPVALTWVGSGAVAAFDGLNQLTLMFGLSGSGAGWSLIDAVLLAKVVIGMSAGAVVALAVTSAAKDIHLQREFPERREARRAEVAAAGSRHTASRAVSARQGARRVLACRQQHALRDHDRAAAGVGLRRAGERPALRTRHVHSRVGDGHGHN